MKSAVRFVVVNHKNDTSFGNGLVMGSADYLYYAVLLKHHRTYIKHASGPLSDTLHVPTFE